MKYLFFFFTLLLSPIVSGQTYNIALGGTHNTCFGTVIDSDAGVGGNYLPNENYTVTLCSNGGGNVINVNFATGIMNIGSGDTLFVYDGNTIGAPLIMYFVNGSVSQQVSTTVSNLTGCITFQFVSDGSGEAGGFLGNISCSNVCQTIEPIVTSTPVMVTLGTDSNYIYVCPGDSVILNGVVNYPQSGISPNHYIQSNATSTFEWSLGDGTIASTLNTSHVYSNEQGYFGQFTVTDVNGCEESFYFKVLHSITPIFSGIEPEPDSICFMDTVELVGGFSNSIGQAFGVSQDSGHVQVGGTVTGQTYLPDGNGVAYTTTINITGFPGQTIASGSDIDHMCVSIEHSYLGDLEMILTCPNGTTVTIFNSYGGGGGLVPGGFGGGGTFLGEAYDSNIGTPGVCWEYCFYDAATNPPWATTFPGTIPLVTLTNPPSPSNGTAIAQGDYQAEQAFSNLIGCPIDGAWTITVQDNIGIDDGYICEWGIELNPAINPNAESYLPHFINGYWETHPDIFNVTDSNAFATPTAVGYAPYTFYVEDDFGCIFDTTVHVYMVPEINPFAGADTTICPNEALDLSATVDLTTSPSCLYKLNMLDSGGDGWDGGKVIVLLNGIPLEGSPFAVTSGSINSVTFAGNTGDAVTLIYIGGGSNNQVSYQLVNSAGTAIYNVNNPANGTNWTGNITCSSNFSYNFLWSPGTNLTSTTVPDPVFSSTTDQTLILEVNHSGIVGCPEYDTVDVSIEEFPIPELLGDFILCIGESTTLTATNGLAYLWSTGDSTSSIDLTPLNDTAISVIVSTVCQDFNLNNIVTVNPPPVVDAGPDTTIAIETSVDLSASGGVQYLWQPPNGLSCFACPDPVASPTVTTTYVVTVLDQNGCSSKDVITVYVEYLPLFLPTAFSPNDDGINDILYLRGFGISSMNLFIYDRNGKIAFQSTDKNDGWDGTIDGKKASSGVYAYQCTVYRSNNEVIELKGNITLVR